VSPIDLFIRRPILTWMLILSLVVVGLLGYSRLGVDQYPKMEYPVVTVSAQLEGANPEVMEEDVTDVLEEYLNAIAGVRSLRSTTTQGGTRVVVEFELGRDIEVAAQDVRDKVARARYELPRDLEPPVVDKVNPTDHPILWVPLHSDRPAVEVSEYLRKQVKPRLETIEGVASIVLFGRRDRNIRIWLDGEALRARGLAATDVLAALRREHVEIPGGLVESDAIEYSVKTDAEFRSIEELGGLIITEVDGAPVLLRDVGRVEDGSEDVRTHARYDGQMALGVGIRKQSGGNTVAVTDEVRARISKMQALLPGGMRFKEGEGLADFSLAIRESIQETLFALQFGAVLATFTVFGFLRRWRPTLIVGISIPFSLVTTFGVMWVLDYTLNTMTLLAMTLAVGVVIDDAIVVLENIERHRELGESPREAASKGASQVAFAATAATVAIAAVFVPVVFARGIVGSFLSEFGATVASAVLLSLVIALTLTPMLAARIPTAKERGHGSIYHRLEQGFGWLESRYKGVLFWALSHRAATLGFAALSLVAAVGFGSQLGSEFFPPADTGRIFVRMETPPGTSAEATLEILKMNERWALAQPEVVGAFSAVGMGGRRSDGDPTEGVIFIVLSHKSERERGALELIREARRAMGAIPGQKVRIFDLSGMMSTSRGAFSFHVQGDLDLETLDTLSDRMIDELDARGGYVDLNKSLKLGRPEIRVIPDREKAAALGVDATTLARTIQAMIGGLDVATFKEAGSRYDIRVRLDEKDRRDPSAIERLFARTRDGGIVELRNLVRIEKGAAPAAITRVDRHRSVTIGGNLEGKKLDEAIAEARAIGAEILPEGVNLTLAGQAEAFAEGTAQLLLTVGLAILVIYMVLAAQFESLIHPLTVMLALPLAMVGALGGLYLWGMTINLFSMIGIILLFGLVTKNSILLVDYANQLRAQGMGKLEAMRTAAPIRMRPVLMTALSMILGVTPAALGIGPGSETRAPMAVATGCGMISSTLLTLVVVPVFYLVLDDAVEGAKRRLRRLLRRSGAPGELPVTR
jgi:hydrophobe/amphiphile efflux-1 (HAE1) family protein